jgi:hypothetical protein
VVATPEAQLHTGCTTEWRRQQAIEELMKLDDVKAPGEGETVLDAKIKALWEKDFESTVALYGDWAWGNVYGYTIHAPVFDDEGEIEDWTELDDSCWGFYGDDHHDSGLEEQALDAVPDEPVRVPDALQENA